MLQFKRLPLCTVKLSHEYSDAVPDRGHSPELSAWSEPGISITTIRNSVLTSQLKDGEGATPAAQTGINR